MQPAFAECCGVALSLLHADLPQKGDKRHLRILPPLMKPVVSSAGDFFLFCQVFCVVLENFSTESQLTRREERAIIP